MPIDEVASAAAAAEELPASAEALDRLREFDTCALANANETFGIRMRNQGYTGPGLHALFPNFPPVLGYAVTSRVRSSNPPMKGGSYYERTDWWETVLAAPSPRVSVIQDLEETPGNG